MKYLSLLAVVPLSAVVGVCSGQAGPLQVGPEPELPKPERGLLPDMVIAEPAEWGDKLPTVPDGYTITAIATNLKIPRQTLVL
ncbi:MAG TPA: sorbosone dehydrogenase family protein, partial [Bordetella sp.]|nr:sorbosone dehydrogenase family protein [Bordetella sp.]